MEMLDEINNRHSSTDTWPAPRSAGDTVEFSANGTVTVRATQNRRQDIPDQFVEPSQVGFGDFFVHYFKDESELVV